MLGTRACLGVQARGEPAVKIAFTHNLRLTDSEEEAEFDSIETVEAIAMALKAAGHEVEKIEVSGPASHLAARLEAYAPDLIFNTAEGRRGRAREGFYPALFEELGFPYTGSDAYVLTLTLDKWLTKLVLARSEEHTSELQSQSNLVCRLLLEKKKTTIEQSPIPPHS